MAATFVAVAEEGKAQAPPPPPPPPPPLLAWSRCPKSGVLKPPRAHFDSASNQLVLNFDHFCPWIFNAVGWQNHRHFFGLVMWVWISTTLGAAVSLSPFLETFGDESVPPWERVALTLLFSISQMLSLVFAIMLAYEVFLYGSGHTAIDLLVLSRRRRDDPLTTNPFSFGSLEANLRCAVTSTNGGFWELLIPAWWLVKEQPFGEPFPGAFGESVRGR